MPSSSIMRYDSLRIFLLPALFYGIIMNIRFPVVDIVCEKQSLPVSAQRTNILTALALPISKTGGESVSKRPKFIIHIGPPKTATTFLQCSLCSQTNITESLLLQDNWVFLGTCPYQSCGQAIKKHPEQFLRHHSYHSKSFFDPKKSQLGPFFVKEVKRLRKLKNNVLVIFEGLHSANDREISLMASFLQKEDWDTRVLVAYRPLYEWLPSKYNSVSKRLESLDVWPGRLDPETEEVGEPWLPFDIRHGGNDDILGRLMREITSTQQHPTEQGLRRFAVHFKVFVMPLHKLPPVGTPNVDSILNYLFCVHLKDESPHICAAVHSRLIGSNIPDNPSVAINYDMLATAAYEAGVIDKLTTWERWEVSDKIQRHQERVLKRTVNDFPLLCLPNETLNEFNRLSWRLEQYLFPEEDEQDHQQHQNGFAKSVAKKKFCWIDTYKTLSDPIWRSFFEKFD